MLSATFFQLSRRSAVVMDAAQNATVHSLEVVAVAVEENVKVWGETAVSMARPVRLVMMLGLALVAIAMLYAFDFLVVRRLRPGASLFTAFAASSPRRHPQTVDQAKKQKTGLSLIHI